MKEVKRILTHVSVDIDAVVSVWFALRFIIKKEVPIDFVPASWDGRGIKFDDLALDINAGGFGIKGKQDKTGKVHSCLKELVRGHADKETKIFLRGLINFVEEIDSGDFDLKNSRTYEKGEIPFLSLVFSLRSLQAYHQKNDGVVCQRMFEILDGMLASMKKRSSDRKSLYSSIITVGRSAIVIKEGSSISARGILFQTEKYDSIVYVDGDNLGLLTRDGLRADLPEVKEVIKKAEEEGEWFSHPAGYLFCRGCRKSPADSPSKVDPYDIAKAIERGRKALLNK